MKTITICGSMRFEAEMRAIAFQLETRHRFNVLQCIYSTGRDTLTALELDALKRAHRRKIDLSDGIYVADIHGYIGDSVREEMEYARTQGKEIHLHSGFGLQMDLSTGDGPADPLRQVGYSKNPDDIL